MERHLISPHRERDGRVAAATYLADLRAAHDAIVDRAVDWASAERGPSWGINAKRKGVDLTGAHPWIYDSEHPINELINLCATIERLLDTLGWAIRGGWADWVIECNPTTSSEPARPDLQTVGPRGQAWFEVSDVVPRRDGNRKMQTDLKRLGQAPSGVTKFMVASPAWEGRVEQHFGFPYEKAPPNDTIVAYVESIDSSAE